MASDVLAKILESVGVQNMISDSDESENSDDDTKFEVDWVQRVVSNTRKRSSGLHSCEKPKKKRQRRWKCRRKLPYSTSMFYKDFHSRTCRVLGHKDAKEFRLNYRMPWSEASKLVRQFIENKWVITQEECDRRRVKGQKVCPPEIKILATLYWLGEGCSFRTIYNLSGRVLSSESFRNFAQKFCRQVTLHLAPEYIKVPDTVKELRQISKSYEERGFPGACGSVDGVQIAWEGCPHAYRVSFTGKEKYPTLGFNVTVGHDYRILHVCSMFAGRFNDKTKVLYDEYVNRLRTDFYDGFTYTVYDSDGVPSTMKIPYLICDGGYHKWLQLMCGFKTTSKEYLSLFSKLLESLRKDVECTFGVLKKRFKILKVPLLFRDVSFIEDLFITCCVLHNWLLDHDSQFNTSQFRVTGRSHDRRRVLVNNVVKLLQKNDDYSYIEQGGLNPETVTQVDSEFQSVRKRLATHTYYVFRNRLI